MFKKNQSVFGIRSCSRKKISGAGAEKQCLGSATLLPGKQPQAFSRHWSLTSLAKGGGHSGAPEQLLKTYSKCVLLNFRAEGVPRAGERRTEQHNDQQFGGGLLGHGLRLLRGPRGQRHHRDSGEAAHQGGIQEAHQAGPARHEPAPQLWWGEGCRQCHSLNSQVTTVLDVGGCQVGTGTWYWYRIWIRSFRGLLLAGIRVPH